MNKGKKTISTITTKNEQKKIKTTTVEDELGGNVRRSTTKE
jgi:hypothetical protein